MGDREAKLKEDALKRLYWQEKFDTTEVHVEVRGETAILTGSVLSYEAKEAAEMAIFSVPEIQTVENRLKVRHPPRRETPKDDFDVQEAIQEMFRTNHELESPLVAVEVHDGVVTLVGNVVAPHEKTLAESIARQAPGVQAIINRIEIGNVV